MTYPCIVADPPWPEQGGGRRGAQNHYPLLKPPQIVKAMLRSPEWNPAPNCHLWLWSPSRIHLAIFVAEALGFTQLGFAVWRKTNGLGLGQYMRYESEIVLLCARGRSMVPSKAARQVIEAPPLIEAPRRGHSVKPDEFYSLFEAVSPGPRLEMFARRRKEGWSAWGNEVDIGVQPL
jgi:N6-adenosine-specific RNA methylase IME4